MHWQAKLDLQTFLELLPITATLFTALDTNLLSPFHLSGWKDPNTSDISKMLLLFFFLQV